jgi:predicted metalloprotease with PDZ domain
VEQHFPSLEHERQIHRDRAVILFSRAKDDNIHLGQARLNQSSENAGVVQSANTTSSSSSYDEELALLTEKVEEAFPKGEILTMTMKDHKPLGCTVEESLNEEDDYVFISKITEGGNADKAGLKVGDVVVGVTGLFGELTVVMDSGVEKM